MQLLLLIPLLAVALVAAAWIGLRVEYTRSSEGKILAFLALAVFPVTAAYQGFTLQMERAQSTEFCLSCHVMTDHGRSLRIDDASYIPAQHFQNNRIPRDRACYACHTDYTMFGDFSAKTRGMRHLVVQYLGTVPKPEALRLYQPYQNRECLHCHAGARRFEEGSAHHKTPDLLPRVKSGALSCLSSGCHEFIHDVGSLKDATFWKE